jgi:serine O-acetyltransferase
MNWWRLYRADLQRYREVTGRSTLAAFPMEQGLWALLIYRLGSGVYHSNLPGVVKRLLLIWAVVGQKFSEVVTGISLPYKAVIGAGLYIGHYGNIIIHPEAVIGRGCNIAQGVSIGVSGTRYKRGVPVIGNRVFIGPNAVVVGKITVGDDVLIGANSLVADDLPRNATALGVPAKIINYRGSREYLQPTDDTEPIPFPDWKAFYTQDEQVVLEQTGEKM